MFLATSTPSSSPTARLTPAPATLLVAGLASALSLILGGCRASGEPADTIFVGDNIVTMDPGRPSADAVAVRGGTIVAVGPRDEVMALRSDGTRLIELGGRALLPGFIDAHGHFTGAGDALRSLGLHPPPVGDVENIDDLVRKVRKWIDDHDIPPGEAVMGRGYDDALLAEGRHPTRFDLDRISIEHPIVLTHVSGHLRAVNSKALEVSGITSATDDPPGGHIRRVAGSREPNGVLEERAGRLIDTGPAPEQTQEELDELVRASIDVYLGYGTTTIQNGGGSSPGMIRALQAVADHEPLHADLAVFSGADGILNDEVQYQRDYTNGMRVAGVKFVLDGSPQGRTAWVTQPYDEGPPGAPDDYTAYGTMDPDEYKTKAAALIERGVPYLAHANGDAAMDVMIAGVREGVAGMNPMPDHRSVIIHAQLMREDQMDEAKDLGIVPSFFSAHAFFWGDWHRRSFGEERASNISPVRWAIDRGVHFTVHNDASVVPPDMMRLVSVTVNRKTRSGFVLGPNQRATVMEALNAVTLGAAYQYFEEDTKGSITVGKQADLVILGENPLTADVADLEHIPILETFSRGRSVFTR